MDDLSGYNVMQGFCQALQPPRSIVYNRARHTVTTMAHSTGTDDSYSKARYSESYFDPIDQRSGLSAARENLSRSQTCHPRIFSASKTAGLKRQTIIKYVDDSTKNWITDKSLWFHNWSMRLIHIDRDNIISHLCKPQNITLTNDYTPVKFNSHNNTH